MPKVCKMLRLSVGMVNTQMMYCRIIYLKPTLILLTNVTPIKNKKIECMGLPWLGSLIG